MIEDDEWEYIGGPCGWMWRRKKEKPLAQDNNPNHLPAGSPHSTGGQFTEKEGGGEVSEKEKYLQDFADRLEASEALLEFTISVLLVIPTRGKSLEVQQRLDQISKFPKKQIFRKLAEEIDRHADMISSLLSKRKKEKLALANTHKPLASEEKTGFSNLFEKKGKASSSKEHINKYADKSKANPNTRVEKAKLEREALSKIDLRLPKPSKELFERYEKEVHLLERHMIEGNAHNPTGMTDVHLIKRAQTGKSASAIHNMETLMESYAKALNRPENQAELRRLLAGKEEKVWLKVDMKRNIGRYVKKGSYVAKDAKKVQFLIKRTKNNPEGFYIETLKLY